MRLPRHVPSVVLLPGVALGPASYDALRQALRDFETIAIDRPRTGDLATELAHLESAVADRFVVGVSGGATLALGLASRVRLAGALIHEPAVGSLVPGLLAGVRAAFTSGGTTAFARALYGDSWETTDGVGDDDVTARELAMFSRFEPSPPLPGQGPILVTTGGRSSALRRLAADVLAQRFGYESRVLEFGGHFIQRENPLEYAEVVRSVIANAVLGEAPPA
jgi:pimeloyl-ACP methyl ester carboxylesterase